MPLKREVTREGMLDVCSVVGSERSLKSRESEGNTIVTMYMPAQSRLNQMSEGG